MRRTLVLVSFAALACSKSPERVCDHLVDMAEKQFGDLDQGGAGMRDKAVQSCVQEKTALKKSDAKKFDCFAGCVLDVRTLAEAADCEPKCGIAPKRHEDEPEPEGIPGLWTDPYADAKEDTNDAPSADANEAGKDGTKADAHDAE